MAITLDTGAAVLDLPDDLVWKDEFAWKAVVQQNTYSLTGALLSESGAKQAGRPLTLVGGDDAAWCDRDTLLALRAAADVPGNEMTLTLLGEAHAVIFDHEGGAIDAKPVQDYSDPDGADVYVITLRFLKV